MNSKQQALFDEVKAAGGQLWIVRTSTWFKNRQNPVWEGRGRYTTAESMIDRDYTPGGYKKHVAFRVIEHLRVYRLLLTDPKIETINEDRLLVEIL